MVNKVKEKKERLDVLLVKRGLSLPVKNAKAVIMAGEVFVDNQREDKAGQTFPESVQVEVRGKEDEICQPWRLQIGTGNERVSDFSYGYGMHGCRFFNRWFYGLYAAKWRKVCVRD